LAYYIGQGEIASSLHEVEMNRKLINKREQERQAGRSKIK
jgi:hypothetical protein